MLSLKFNIITIILIGSCNKYFPQIEILAF
nr:MAG TPA: hypothetical protein [Caudoviricetes sp.]